MGVLHVRRHTAARGGVMTAPPPLTAAVRCPVCGTVPYATAEEADKRAEQHTRVTRHPTTAEVRRAVPRAVISDICLYGDCDCTMPGCACECHDGGCDHDHGGSDREAPR